MEFFLMTDTEEARPTQNWEDIGRALADVMSGGTEFVVLRITYGMFDEHGNLKNPPKPQEPANGGGDGEDLYFDFE